MINWLIKLDEVVRYFLRGRVGKKPKVGISVTSFSIVILISIIVTTVVAILLASAIVSSIDRDSKTVETGTKVEVDNDSSKQFKPVEEEEDLFPPILDALPILLVGFVVLAGFFCLGVMTSEK